MYSYRNVGTVVLNLIGISIVSPSIQHRRFLISAVNSGNSLKAVGLIHVIRRHFYCLSPTQIAIPFELPPPCVSGIGSSHVVGQVACIIPICRLSLHLLIFKHGLPLNQLPRNAHITQLAVFRDVHVNRINSILLFQFPIAFIMTAEGRKTFLTEFMPHKNIRKSILALSMR